MALIDVVCGVLTNDRGEILLCRRKIEKSLGGFWEFPGGKVERDERSQDALKRELLEELDLEVVILERIGGTFHYAYPSASIALIPFKCQLHRMGSKMEAHDLIQWVQKSDLLKFQLAPADVPIANELINLPCDEK